MEAPPDIAVRDAMRAAARSPCEKSKRGCSIYRTYPDLFVLSSGYNGQPQPWTCERNARCASVCNKVCVHAEMRAIKSALEVSDLSETILVHVKYEDGVLATSGGPSCWQCSREVLDSGLDGVWLYHGAPTSVIQGATGWRFYSSVEFHDLTREACGLNKPPKITKHFELTDDQLRQTPYLELRDAYRELREHHITETTILAERLKEARKQGSDV